MVVPVSAGEVLKHTQQLAAFHYHTDGHLPAANNVAIYTSYELRRRFILLSHARLAYPTLRPLPPHRTGFSSVQEMF